MRYNDLIQLYFERSSALQWYWTLYVIVIGGLLAFSSLRKEPDVRTVLLVLVLYGFFAYKNLGAIHEANDQRQAILQAAKSSALSHDDVAGAFRQSVEPTLIPQDYESIRNFHLATDLLTISVICVMELRRVRYSRQIAQARGGSPA